MFPLRRKKDDEQRLPFSENISENEARIVVDEEGTIVFASAAFMDLGHLTRETISNHNFSTILTFENPAESPNDIESGHHKIWINGNQSTQDFHFDWINLPASNGNRRFLIGSYANEKAYNDPAPIITSIKPEEAKEPLANLQTAHSTHDDIDVFLSLSREMMIVTDENDKILRANSRFSNAIGYSANELDNIKFIDLFDDEDKDIIQSQDSCEARILNQTGECLWAQWHKQSRDGLTYYAGRDITAIKTQQKALSHREKQLIEAEKLGRMGHWQWTLGEDSIEWSSEIYFQCPCCKKGRMNYKQKLLPRQRAPPRAVLPKDP
ncbi:MAG: PAS domain S-box protein [Pseudomonadota bacterium]